MKNLIQLIVFLLFISGFSQSILDRELVKFEGFFDFYYDTATDKIYLEVEKLDSDFLGHFQTWSQTRSPNWFYIYMYQGWVI